MKYAEDIVKEIKERGPIDTTGCMIDKNDAWEDYIRGIPCVITRQESEKEHD